MAKELRYITPDDDLTVEHLGVNGYRERARRVILKYDSATGSQLRKTQQKQPASSMVLVIRQHFLPHVCKTQLAALHISS